MHLDRIHLINFKNFVEETFEFSPSINAFVGNNGIGKTNLLDAVYYLGSFKSYFNHAEISNVRFNEEFFVVEGWFRKDEKEDHVFSSVKIGDKKIVRKNDKAYKRISEHIGQFPVVIISPYDRDLIQEGSDVRRKFIDSIIAQGNSKYLTQLIRYNKVLSQRNALLKYFAANKLFNENQLEAYSVELFELGAYIYSIRKEFIQDFTKIFKLYYSRLSSGNETVDIQYDSILNEEPDNYLRDSLQKDLRAQFSTAGVHRDNFVFLINGYPIKKFGSQGQQKSFLIALKLAQLQRIKDELNITPILLLDDIFDKLDESRVEKLIKMVNNDYFGQIFISDTHPERTKKVLSKINDSHKIFEL